MGRCRSRFRTHTGLYRSICCASASTIDNRAKAAAQQMHIYDMLPLILATVVALLVLLVFAYVLWNLTTDYRKLDCSCEHSPGYVWLMCRALWQAALKRQGEASHAEWRRALQGAADSGSKEQMMGKHEQLQKLQKLLRMDWLALRYVCACVRACVRVCVRVCTLSACVCVSFFSTQCSSIMASCVQLCVLLYC